MLSKPMHACGLISHIRVLRLFSSFLFFFVPVSAFLQQQANTTTPNNCHADSTW